MNDDKKTEYWRGLSEYDLDTAFAMLESKRYLYVGFMCHQSVEKILKAVFVKKIQDTPPYTHSLIDLAKRCGIYGEFSEEQKDLLDLLQPFNIEARYPAHKEKINKLLNPERSEQIFTKTKVILEWITEKYLAN